MSLLLHEKHAGASRSLQRFEHAAAFFLGKGLDLIPVTGDQRPRADFLGKKLEVHLGRRFGQSVGIVDDDHAVTHGDAAEFRSR